MAKFKVADHILVPEHTVLNDKEKQALLDKYHITIKDLPKIIVKDIALDGLKVKLGDVVKIERNAPSGTTYFFRRVSDA